MKKSKQGAPDSARLFDASRARAGASTGVPAPTRVVCSGHTQTGINDNTCLSDHAHVRAKARRRKFTEAENTFQAIRQNRYCHPPPRPRLGDLRHPES